MHGAGDDCSQQCGAGIEIDRTNDFTEYPWVYKAGMQVEFNTWFTGRVGYDSELGDQTAVAFAWAPA